MMCAISDTTYHTPAGIAMGNGESYQFRHILVRQIDLAAMVCYTFLWTQFDKEDW